MYGRPSSPYIYTPEDKFRYVYTPEYHVNPDIIPKPLLRWIHKVLDHWRGVSADQTRIDIESQLSPAALTAFTQMPALY